MIGSGLGFGISLAVDRFVGQSVAKGPSCRLTPVPLQLGSDNVLGSLWPVLAMFARGDQPATIHVT